jgi:predicted AAA+ superfamily ATPase
MTYYSVNQLKIKELAMYIKRIISIELKKALSLFPVCVVTGARQTGKSTLLENELPDYTYITFDDPIQRDFAKSDPVGFLGSFAPSPGIILDEIQYVPSLLSYIKMDIDKNRVPGRWVLTGSQQFHLMKNISESLAGRAILFDLAPFCCNELHEPKSLTEILWTGLYPEPELCPEKRELWLRSYLQTYLERDIRQLGNVVDLNSFESLINLCAARHSQELNLSALSRASGVAAITAKKWIGLLESCYLLYLLRPFHNNLGKRIVKSPKLYFMDPALAGYLTRQPSADAMLSGSMGGNFFEGLIVAEAVKCFYNRGKHPELYYWRSHDGLEVDLIIQIGNTLYPVEIKCSATPKSSFMTPLNQFKKTAQASSLSVAEGLLVCQAPKPVALPNGNQCLPWNFFYQWLDDKLSALQ